MGSFIDHFIGFLDRLTVYSKWFILLVSIAFILLFWHFFLGFYVWQPLYVMVMGYVWVLVIVLFFLLGDKK